MNRLSRENIYFSFLFTMTLFLGSFSQPAMAARLASLSYLALSPSSVTGGQSAVLTVKLTRLAPSGGALVSLSSNQPSVTSLPASVLIPAGQSSATVSVSTGQASSPTSATLSGNYRNVIKSTSLTIYPSTTSPSPSPTPAPSPAPTPTTGTTIDPLFFGMHYSSVTYQPWPQLSFSTFRTWDQYPGVSWMSVNPARDQWNWSTLDTVVNTAASKGVDIIYTFGYVPQWASSNPNGACDGGAPAGSCYAPNTVDWQNFVAAVTSRYKGKIKFFELWNEPNAGGFWKGTPAQLVTMAQAAYQIIKDTGATVLSPAPQGTNAHQWLDSYFAAGGAQYADIVAFHGYLYGAPELIVTLANNIKSTMAKYNLSSKPLWDTEHSWGDPSWPFGSDQDQQAAWLARYLPLSVSSGIQRSLWYLYDCYPNQAQWGCLYSIDTKTLQKPGIAYREVYNWLVNASMDPCVQNGSIYQCHLVRSNGYEGLIVWNAVNTSSTASFTVPSGYTRYRTVDGSTISVNSGSGISVGMKPILIEKLQ